jgi:cytochrome P450
MIDEKKRMSAEELEQQADLLSVLINDDFYGNNNEVLIDEMCMLVTAGVITTSSTN